MKASPRPPPPLLCPRLVAQVRRLARVCVCFCISIHVHGLTTSTVAESGSQSLNVSVAEK